MPLNRDRSSVLRDQTGNPVLLAAGGSIRRRGYRPGAPLLDMSRGAVSGKSSHSQKPALKLNVTNIQTYKLTPFHFYIIRIL